MAFRYLRDPVFLGALSLFALNELLLKRLSHTPFFYHHFNDLLLIPCALPLLLLLHALLGLRGAAAAPTAAEVIGHLLVWSVLFEFAAPRLAQHATGDYRDIFCYWLGGGLAWLAWKAVYQSRPSNPLAAA